MAGLRDRKLNSDKIQETQRRATLFRYEFNFFMERETVSTMMSKYSLENIYNADEIAGFIKCCQINTV